MLQTSIINKMFIFLIDLKQIIHNQKTDEFARILRSLIFVKTHPLDTGRILNVYKAFRRREERLLNVLCTFNLGSVSIRV